ncbi:MAG: hypothetical protein COA50_12010 [Flavobacteriaceae bacterium]|nr:MAG: hypothetical protein COA50_12010 [Flavobacteriaceae bacterium]
MKTNNIFICCCFIILFGCKKDPVVAETSLCPAEGLIQTFTTPDGEEFFIYEDGAAYTNSNGSCNFELQYFDAKFIAINYETIATETFLITDEGDLFPTKSNFYEDFENTSEIEDLFVSSLTDTHLYWTSFTLQSPATPEVADYTNLFQCIMNGTCTFIDNKIEVIKDPTDASNQVLQLTSISPTAAMVTSKTSISSSLNFYPKDSELWFEADYYILDGMPFSIVDFESTYFFQEPGPRIVIRERKLELENKFGSKLNFENTSAATISPKQWFTLKVHLKFSDVQDGVIEIWQDGIPIISTVGINLPISNSIQNILEVGATASSIGCILLMDNIRISNTPF